MIKTRNRQVFKNKKTGLKKVSPVLFFSPQEK